MQVLPVAIDQLYCWHCILLRDASDCTTTTRFGCSVGNRMKRPSTAHCPVSLLEHCLHTKWPLPPWMRIVSICGAADVMRCDVCISIVWPHICSIVSPLSLSSIAMTAFARAMTVPGHRGALHSPPTTGESASDYTAYIMLLITLSCSLSRRF